MKSLHQTYLISAPIHDVWQAFVNPADIDAWGGGPSQMSEIPGHKFSLWGGDVWGKNLEVEREKKLSQEWTSGKKWDKPSHVTFTLEEAEGGTRLTLDQTGIPDDDFTDVKQGWTDYYIKPLKEYIEGK